MGLGRLNGESLDFGRRRTHAGEVILAVEFADHQSVKIDVLKAAQIYRGHIPAVWATPFAERRNAAGGAEIMIDDVLVEFVGGEIQAISRQVKTVAGDEGQQSATPATQGAIAIQRFGKVAFDLEADLAAVAATVM